MLELPQEEEPMSFVWTILQPPAALYTNDRPQETLTGQYRVFAANETVSTVYLVVAIAADEGFAARP